MNCEVPQQNGMMHEPIPDLETLCHNCDALVRQCFDSGQMFANHMEETKRVKQFLANNVNLPADQLTQYQHHYKQLQEHASYHGHNLLQSRCQLLTQFQLATGALSTQVTDIITFLTRWLHCLKWTQIGFPFDDKEERLTYLQQTFSQLANQILQLRGLVMQSTAELRRIELPNSAHAKTQAQINDLNNLMHNLTLLFVNLVSHSFVVVKQPEPILNVNKKIKVHLRLLLSKNLIEQQLKMATVTLHLVPEEDAKLIQNGQSQVKKFKDTEIVNPVVRFTTADEDDHLKVDFEQSKISKIPNRRAKINANHQQAAEQQYAFVFTVTPVNGSLNDNICIWDIPVQLKTISLPFAFSVHHKQEHSIEMQAMMFWERAFGDVVRQNATPLIVSWDNLSPSLSSKLQQFTRIKTPLTMEQTQFLFNKINQPYNAISYKTLLSSTLSVCDKPLEFFAWYFGVMETLAKAKLQHFWDQGWLAGFVTKLDVERCLKASAEPACMLRFSDTMAGAISIAFVTKTCGGQKPEVKHLSPLTFRDLEQMTLAHRLTTSPDLKHITVILTGRPIMPMVPISELITYAANEPAPAIPKDLKNGYTPHINVMTVMQNQNSTNGSDPSLVSQGTSRSLSGEDQSYDTTFSPFSQHQIINSPMVSVVDICKMLDEDGISCDMDDLSTVEPYGATRF